MYNIISMSQTYSQLLESMKNNVGGFEMNNDQRFPDAEEGAGFRKNMGKIFPGTLNDAGDMVSQAIKPSSNNFVFQNLTQTEHEAANPIIGQTRNATERYLKSLTPSKMSNLQSQSNTSANLANKALQDDAMKKVKQMKAVEESSQKKSKLVKQAKKARKLEKATQKAQDQLGGEPEPVPNEIEPEAPHLMPSVDDNVPEVVPPSAEPGTGTQDEDKDGEDTTEGPNVGQEEEPVENAAENTESSASTALNDAEKANNDIQKVDKVVGEVQDVKSAADDIDDVGDIIAGSEGDANPIADAVGGGLDLIGTIVGIGGEISGAIAQAEDRHKAPAPPPQVISSSGTIGANV
jgi:hypothetical protein